MRATGVRPETALRLASRRGVTAVIGVPTVSVSPNMGVRIAGVRGNVPAVAVRSRDLDRRRSALTVAVVGVGAPRRTRSAHSLLAYAAFSGA